jgi:DNA-binding NtrC family response regulator
VITATNRNLLEAATAREFREDLYYRLNVFEIRVPPLRDRPSDIPILLEYYLRWFGDQHGQGPLAVSEATPRSADVVCAARNVRRRSERSAPSASSSLGPTIEPAALPVAIVSNVPATQESAGHAREAVSHQARVDALIERLQRQESFWTSAYSAFMARDITRDDMRLIIRVGLEQTHGSYRLLVGLFNMSAADYKRFLSFLKQHDCNLPFQRFRGGDRTAQPGRGAIAKIAS